MKIAVLGLGNMGQAIAGRLLAGGHDVVVWNRSAGKAEALVHQGAREAPSISEAVTGAEVALTSLASDDAVRETVLGPGGVLSHLEGRGIYADCSTSSPALTRELAEEAPERYVALPILGPPEMVSSGEATYLTGGPSETVERLQPLLDTLTSKVFSYDAPPLAAVAKLTSNLLLLAGVLTLSEAIAVGRSGELSDDQLRELLSESPMVAPGIRNRFEGILTGEQPHWWGAALGAKDVRLALEVADGAQIDLPEADVVRRRYEEIAEKEGPSVDVAAVAHLYRPGH